MPLTDVIPSQRQAGLLILAFAAGVAVGANWPAIRQALGPLLAGAGDKVDDLYAAVAQVLGEKKETMQDARAERRHRARTTRTRQGEQDLVTRLTTLFKSPAGPARPAAKRARKRPVRRPRKVSAAPSLAAAAAEARPSEVAGAAVTRARSSRRGPTPRVDIAVAHPAAAACT